MVVEGMAFALLDIHGTARHSRVDVVFEAVVSLQRCHVVFVYGQC